LAPGSDLGRASTIAKKTKPRSAPEVNPARQLICPADQIFDSAGFVRAIDEAAASCDSPAALRSAAVALLTDANAKGRAKIADCFAQQPFAARAVTSAYSYLTDGLVTSALYLAQTHLHPLPNPTKGEHIALIAVGGYGRGEMAPFSDVDLLFLTPYKTTAWAESVIESMLYILWDLKLKVGHASRTIKDCIRLGREDFTIRTALLEHRTCGKSGHPPAKRSVQRYRP